MKRINALAASVLLLSACTVSQQMKHAQALEKKGEYYKAWQRYQEIAADHPQSERAPEALFRAGWVAQRRLNDCRMAGVFYEKVAATYPQSDWARLATNQANNCPDYFPLMPGFQWVEGDSDTKGRNARIDIVCKAAPGKDTLPSESGMLERTYYAGKEKFKTTQAVYKKVDGDVQEFATETELRPKVIFHLPPVVGSRWKTIAANHQFSYEITAIDKTVKVEAGEFSGCVMVQSRAEGASGSTNEYYAPSVGKVLTTLSTPNGEKRNTELLSYQPVQEIDFAPNSKKP